MNVSVYPIMSATTDDNCGAEWLFNIITKSGYDKTHLSIQWTDTPMIHHVGYDIPRTWLTEKGVKKLTEQMPAFLENRKAEGMDVSIIYVYTESTYEENKPIVDIFKNMNYDYEVTVFLFCKNA